MRRSRDERQDPEPHVLERVVVRNIQAILEARDRAERKRTTEERVAAAITRFTGSMRFVYLQAGLVGAWIVLNLGVVPWIVPWDPFPFVMLAVLVSVEAIFLATFVLLSQNRAAELAERRAHLDLQVNLLAEHEITKVLGIVDAIAKRLGIESPEREHVDMLKEEVVPEAVLDVIEREEQAERDR